MPPLLHRLKLRNFFSATNLPENMDVALFLLQEIDLKIWSNPVASGGFAPRTPI